MRNGLVSLGRRGQKGVTAGPPLGMRDEGLVVVKAVVVVVMMAVLNLKRRHAHYLCAFPSW